MGQAPKGASYNKDGVGAPLIAGAGDFGELFPETSKFTTEPTKLSCRDEIILCIRATIGERNWADGEYCLGRGVAGLIARSDILDQRYLWHWLAHAGPSLKAKGKGATFLQVSKADIASMEIPLPPLEEQRRIASILDKADALRAKRREAIAKLDQLLQSVFLDMFGDPVINPMEWGKVSFADVVYFQEGPGVRKWQFRSNGVKLINVINIVDGELDLSRSSRYLDTDEVTQNYQRFLLETGDYVMSSSGVTWGKIAEVRSEHLPLCLNTSMIRLRPRDERIKKQYLRAFIEGPSFRQQIRRLITGSAQPNFGPSHLNKLKIPLPPVDLQEKFSNRTLSVIKQKQSCEIQLKQINKLFAAIQQRAFAGQA